MGNFAKDLRPTAQGHPLVEQLSFGQHSKYINKRSVDNFLHVKGAVTEAVFDLVENLDIRCILMPSPALIRTICYGSYLLSELLQDDHILHQKLHLLSLFKLIEKSN